MGRQYDTVSFLSDYGLVDEVVGVVKSVIRSIAPPVRVIDITHQVPAHDVRAGSLALVRSVQYLAPGVVLAVVDPGVGTDRRGVAVAGGGGGAGCGGPARACSGDPTTGGWRRRWPWREAPPGPSSSPRSATTCRRPARRSPA